MIDNVFVRLFMIIIIIIILFCFLMTPLTQFIRRVYRRWKFVDEKTSVPLKLTRGWS